MSNTNPVSRKPRPLSRAELIRRHGFYAHTFTTQELRHLEEHPDPFAEIKLLRTKILRMAKLTALKKINDKELEALIKLVRVVAALDALERTDVMARKVDGTLDPALQALAGMDPDDL